MNQKSNNSNVGLPQRVVQSMQNLLVNLYERWKDEKEYEDFSEYEEVMKKKADEISEITFIKATKRPFGFKFKNQNRDYQVSITAKGTKLYINCSSI